MKNIKLHITPSQALEHVHELRSAGLSASGIEGDLSAAGDLTAPDGMETPAGEEGAAPGAAPGRAPGHRPSFPDARSSSVPVPARSPRPGGRQARVR